MPKRTIRCPKCGHEYEVDVTPVEAEPADLLERQDDGRMAKCVRLQCDCGEQIPYTIPLR